MTTATANAPASAASPSPLTLADPNHFLMRRLHSLTGLMPIGVFLCFHLFTNAQMLLAQITGEKHFFQDEVNWIHALPALLMIEIFGLWLPIAFHTALGLVYIFSGKTNVQHYKYSGNVRYTLQRVTAIIAMFFIFYHVASLRWGWFGNVFIAEGANGYPLAHATTAVHMQDPLILMAPFYLLGALSAVFHFANGLWTSAITWGVTTTPASMKRWGYVCAALGVALTAFTLASVYSASTYEVTQQDLDAINAYLHSAEVLHTVDVDRLRALTGLALDDAATLDTP